MRASENTFEKIQSLEDAQAAIHFNGARLWTVEVDADPKYEREIVPRLRQFYDDHLNTGTPPPVDYSRGCKQALRLMYPYKDEAVEITPEMERDARAYLFNKVAERKYANDKAAAANRIRDLLAGNLCAIDPEAFSAWSSAKTKKERDKAVKLASKKISLSKVQTVLLKGFDDADS